MDFYKILNIDEKHHNFQYKYGLNIDTVPFNPHGSCIAGGIYFAREDILAFLDYGPWIRKVMIPEDAQVYENPGEPKKWKADRVILGKKEKITAGTIRRLIDEGANINPSSSTALLWAIVRNYYKMVEVLLEAGSNPNIKHPLLEIAGQYNFVKIVKLLLKHKICLKRDDFTSSANNPIVIKLLTEYDIKYHNGENSISALYWAIRNRQKTLIKTLIKNNVNINRSDSLALKIAIRNDYIYAVKLLLPISTIDNSRLKETIKLSQVNNTVKTLLTDYMETKK
jgi:hypothetical protein